MSGGDENCAICAWRETCLKKYSLSGRDMKCADYTPDVTIRHRTDPPDEGVAPKGE